jgi:uncharacterized protein YoxC
MNAVELGPVASTILVTFYVLASLLLVGLIGAVAFLVWKLNGILERYEEKIEPVLEKADAVLTLIGEKADSIGGKAELLLTQGEEMAETVHDKVDRTATAVQKTINAPIIRANSLAAAVTQGLATFARLQGRAAGPSRNASAIPDVAREGNSVPSGKNLENTEPAGRTENPTVGTNPVTSADSPAGVIPTRPVVPATDRDAEREQQPVLLGGVANNGR